MQTGISRLSGELGKGSMMLDIIIIIQGMCCRERVQV